MELTEKTMKFIDDMSYEELLQKHRFAPSGDPIFEGETGYYFSKRMGILRAALPEGEHAETSKRIGWDR